MDCKVDRKLPIVLDYDEKECQCLECHQKRKYSRGKKIYGHDPPVSFKKNFIWYQLSCSGDGPSTLFLAKCPHTGGLAKTTPRPDIAMRSPPYIISPEDKDCSQGTECHNTGCEMCKNEGSEESKKLETIQKELADSL